MKMNMYLKAFFSGIFGVFCGLCIVFTIFHLFIHPISFVGDFYDSTYNLYSNWESENSKLVSDTITSCGIFSNYDEVACVVETGKRFNYTNREDNIVKKSDELNSGYLCRDIAIFYDAVFKKLGYQTDFLFTDNHIYNRIYKNDLDCQINMDRYRCW